MGGWVGGWVAGLSGNIDHLNPIEVEVEVGLGLSLATIWGNKIGSLLKKMIFLATIS